ncbi:DUF4331 domain-containing protein [Pelagicoccus sp. NFK12]|uniref:DUF4331 domain-containing protein n=1 Tax=Pelagicoccus enzymogenes TaxID=2773457 RepID=A0A927F804_9BACT|nr:DUF4331 domain-containing protein [Pelagicoccus enzymogenes]MBD5779554.1 DUF4331 domain-containing protein [Pelagicoccus enzymogenes]
MKHASSQYFGYSLGTLRKTCLASLAGIIATAGAFAASHSDAPLIKQDPQANLTDVYAFVGTKYDDPETKVLNVLVSVRPFSDPGDGVIYERFSTDALYSIHLANPTTGKSFRQYDFRFSSTNSDRAPVLKNPDTILSYGLGTEVGAIQEPGDARQNYTQYYWVAKNRRYLTGALVIPPPNVGANTTPFYNDMDGEAVSGAANLTELDSYTRSTIYDLPSGEAVYAGPREDGFYADTPAIFDLLDSRILDNTGDLSDGLGQDGNGVDGFQGFNVLTYSIQIPISSLPEMSYSDPFFGDAKGVGVYATVSRPSITLRNHRGDYAAGRWVQVNRMGNPLFNEVLVALKDKDAYNRSSPTSDSRYASYATNPEVATLINTVYGTNFQASGRVDLKAVFIPDVLRVNTQTDPVRLPGQEGYSRLGFIGGDTTSGVNSGWPNGRRIGDDVVDIALTAVASGPSYQTITLVGDNVASNDASYHQVFPYLATPHAGPTTDQRESK